jgi:hypothetical protein
VSGRGPGLPTPPASLRQGLAERAGGCAVIDTEAKGKHGRCDVWVLGAFRPGAGRGRRQLGDPRDAVTAPLPALWVERHRLTVRRDRVLATAVEVRYHVMSARPARADAKALLAAIRGHLGIENRLHYVRDMTFDEDRCQVRGGAMP